MQESPHINDCHILDRIADSFSRNNVFVETVYEYRILGLYPSLGMTGLRYLLFLLFTIHAIL